MEQQGFKVHDATTFINEQLPSKPEIISGGILPQNSIAIVGGISKEGKSVLVLNMAIATARGTPFLGFNVPFPKRVLYLQAEISAHSMQDRLRKMLHFVDYDLIQERLFIINFKGLKLDRKEHLEQISKVVEHHRVSVLIIDPLYKFHGGDENRVSDMARFFDRIDWLIQRHNCSCVVVHHFGKPQEGRDGATMFRGSSTITDYADSYLMLQRKSKESRLYVKLSFSLRNAEEPEPMILYRDPETLWYSVEQQESKDKVTAQDCVQALESLGGFTQKKELLIAAIMQQTLSGRTSVKTAIAEAERLGLILSDNGTGRKRTFYLPNLLVNGQMVKVDQ